jgi:hypothetical protein
LAFPASLLLLLSSLFLAGTLWQSSPRTKGEAWKSSMLALLFHGLSSDTLHHVGKADRVTEVTLAARGLKVQLRRNEDGWQFEEVPKAQENE